MNRGHFYFIKNTYFTDFPDPYLMQNKEIIQGQPHSRPCFYFFKTNSSDIFWMIPFSSQIQKYSKVYEHKVKKYGNCDTIVFGNVLGYRKAFLIQNMFPVTSKYIDSEYIHCATPVRVAGSLEKELMRKAKKVLALQRKGFRLILPDVLSIERALQE